MKKLFLLSLFTVLQYNSQVKITYNNIIYNEKFESILIINEDKSLYTEFQKKIKPGTEFTDKMGKLNGTLIDKKYQFFKSKKENRVYYNSTISYNKTDIIKQKNDLIWKINDTNKKKILNFNCIEATTTYRGRNYTAYFTKEIKNNDGPRVFFGLPGVILEIKESNSKLFIQAIDIVEDNNQNVYLSPNFDIKKAVEWDKALSNAKLNYQAKREEIQKKYDGVVSVDFSNALEVYDLNK